MKKLLLLIFLVVSCACAVTAKRQAIDVRHIEPMEWWAGMHRNELQLMMHGHDIARCQVRCDGLPISRQVRTANPNYLFLYLDLTDVRPGEYDIELSRGKLRRVVKYRVNARREGSAGRESFSSADAVYLIMPDRFANALPGNDCIPDYHQCADCSSLHLRQGGDLQGIIDHLDYIADLGFTAIWTTPVLDDNDKSYSYHHYSTTNFYQVDPRFGSNDDFRRLISEMHRRGLKYIFDIVPNHANPRHWWHDDLPDSTWYHQTGEPMPQRTNHKVNVSLDPHASDYDRRQLHEGWFDSNMTDLNLANPLLRDYVLQSYLYWIEWAGIDGLRVDTYPYIEKNEASMLMRSIREEYPRMNIVAECWVKSVAEMAYYQSGVCNNDGYDSNVPTVMDFVLKDHFETALKEEEAWDRGLIRFYNHFAQDFALADPLRVMNFVDNHDMPRYSNACDRDVPRYLMGLALLATVRGMPQYFYGDEIMIDAQGSTYEDCRPRFPGGWAADTLNAFVREDRSEEQEFVHSCLRRLLRFRKGSDALCFGRMRQFLPWNGTYVFFRYTDTDTVMVAVNNNDETFALNTDRFAEMDVVGHTAHDIITDSRDIVGDTIMLRPRTTHVFHIEK